MGNGLRINLCGMQYKITDENIRRHVVPSTSEALPAKMKVTVVAEEWRRRWLTVVGQQGCSQWLDNTVAHGGCGTASCTMELKKRRIGLVQKIRCISQLNYYEIH